MDFSPLWISIKTATLSTVITFFLGIIVSYWMSNFKGKSKGIIDGIFTLPLILPPTVVGFFLLLICGKNGPIGKLLELFNTSLIFSWSATVIAAIVVSFPMMYRTTRSAFEQIDINILSAARTLGLSEFKIFYKIAIPLAMPGIIGGLVLSFARAMGEFGATLMLAGNIPGKTQTMPLAIFFAAEGGDMQKAILWVIIIVTLSLFLILILNYWSEVQLKLMGRSAK
ncbi:molybdate ABC transporter permease subunit [Clostridium beijerinckii]|jgi:molybdate transport system permease protein|uniref:Molybdenum transport system permease n=1 Tax=Clostridium beijerinckii TaxID=1520 RepID=A0AAW3WEB8_CLOBE|nr:molybdate ABC transporter permease subunit [Clostridium beijerinckii]MBC2459263.1 molybdate ABC transporter permease subunit [Clostridium beijerinckii]MBC2476793.1 molybdate ABC transporter permease subunit [Clostridium beijerinckii]NOV59461.1 molybdate transport system permease protein [Clostridium beijerinckii]NOV72616.1 molybdate transport system permease protein [Clostridium beijerinckii]NOW34685.1 molybdate transport system permease protein [Clostridium beijerinckii]